MGVALHKPETIDEAMRLKSEDSSALFLAGGQTLIGRCQVKAIGSPKIVEPASSGRKLTPLGKGSGAIEFEVFAAVEVTFLIKMIAD